MNQNYLNHIKLNFTEGTYRHDLSHIKHFEKWCDENKIITLDDLTDSAVVGYISYMRETCETSPLISVLGLLKGPSRPLALKTIMSITSKNLK